MRAASRLRLASMSGGILSMSSLKAVSFCLGTAGKVLATSDFKSRPQPLSRALTASVDERPFPAPGPETSGAKNLVEKASRVWRR